MTMFAGSDILITGGTGSFGRKCAETLLRRYHPRRLVIFSRDEQKHVEMSRDLFPPRDFPEVRYFVGDVRDRGRLQRAMRGIDYVVHAAAMKHVDLAEYNPQECISTNIGGAQNVIDACIDTGVKRVVALSTDKAAAPVNLYGATKLCSDKLFAAANSLSGDGGTRFCSVRYGNVLDSNGSVVPFFQKQRSQGVLPVTSPEMTRFIITLEHGVDFVLRSFERMAGGEIFVPKIPSTSIMEIAEAIAPECQIEVVGVRPGEKVHECMIPVDEARMALEFDDHFVVQPSARNWTREEPAYLRTGKPCPEGFCYSSETNPDWLSVEEFRELVGSSCHQPVVPTHAAVKATPAPAVPRLGKRPSADGLRQAHRASPLSVRYSVLPYGRHSIDQSDIDAVVAALRSGVLTQGPELSKFEKSLAQVVGAEYAVACSSGTAALHMAYAAAGIGDGDVVVVPANTFLATANAAIYLNAEVRFCDVDPVSGLMTPDTLELVIDASVRAVVPVHFAGQPCDMPEIASVVRRRAPQATLIEDACHALGGMHGDRTPVGKPGYSAMTTFSLHPVKHIAAGEGGAVTTDDLGLKRRLESMRSHGMTKDPDSLRRDDEGPWYYEMHSPGFNYRISEMSCALATSQLNRLPSFVARRRQLASRYIDALSGMDGVTVPSSRDLHTSAWHLFCLHIHFDHLGLSRRQLLASLAEAGVGAQVHYFPLPLQPYYQDRYGYCESQIPGAVKHYEQALSIPCFPAMTDAQQEDVIQLFSRLVQPRSRATMASR